METTGPGKQVARNVQQLRKRRGMTVRDLSARLAELGRPILPSGITKIEQGGRRVDADDLVALAVALGVNPNALLLPAGEPATTVHLTETLAVPWSRAWRWVTGEAPLDAPASGDRRVSELAEWVETTRPHKEREEILAEMAAAHQLFAERLESIEQDVRQSQERHDGKH